MQHRRLSPEGVCTQSSKSTDTANFSTDCLLVVSLTPLQQRSRLCTFQRRVYIQPIPQRVVRSRRMGLSCTYCSGVDESTIPCYPFEIRRPPNISSLQGTSNQRSKCAHSRSMTPVTDVRARQSVPSLYSTT